MTALADALEASGHLPPVPGRRVQDRTDPQLAIHYWNHPCPQPGCMAWVPNHRRWCADHPKENP